MFVLHGLPFGDFLFSSVYCKVPTISSAEMSEIILGCCCILRLYKTLFLIRIYVVIFSFSFTAIRVTPFLSHLLIRIPGDITFHQSVSSQFTISPPEVSFINLPKPDLNVPAIALDLPLEVTWK